MMSAIIRSTAASCSSDATTCCGSPRTSVATSEPDVSCRSTSTAIDRPTRNGCASSSLGSSAMRTGTRQREGDDDAAGEGEAVGQHAEQVAETDEHEEGEIGRADV